VEYVTIKKAAEMLGVSRPTVYKLIAEGKIKTREFVGRPAIAVSEIAKRKANGKAK
jgi:excisionase family DNA binding protein